MVEFDAYTGDKVVLKEEDLNKVGTLVEDSAAIQGAYNKCTDEESKRKLTMKYHTAMRSFNNEVVFCCARRPDDKEECGRRL